MFESYETSGLDDKQLVDGIAACQRRIAALQADQVRLVAELSTRRLNASIEAADRAVAEGMPEPVRRAIEATMDDGASEVALALSLAPGTAGRLVDACVRLTRSLPLTLAALADGRLDLSRAQVVAAETACLSAEHTAVVDAKVEATLALGHVLTRGQLQRRVRDTVARLERSAVAARHRKAAEQRGVWVEPAPDGMATLHAHGPAAGIMAIWTAIDAAAAVEVSPVSPSATGAKGAAQAGSSTSDTRRIGARRFDALLGWASGVLADPDVELPTRQGQRPHIQVTIAATTLLGLDQQPGHLDGYGAIPAHVARKIAAVGEWRRLLTDPQSGALLDVGRKTYVPPAALRDFVLTRDRTCTHPTCSTPSRRTQIDHLLAYPAGPTAEWNHGPACGPHHRVKTHRPGWRVERLPDGSVAWTAPTGHVYVRPPDGIVRHGLRSPGADVDDHDDAVLGVAELRRALELAGRDGHDGRDSHDGGVSVVADSFTDALYASTPPY